MSQFSGRYDYNNHRVTLSDSRSDNSVQGLTSFQLDAPVDPTWPGTTTEPDVTRVQPQRLESVAAWLQATAEQLNEVTQLLSEAATCSYGPPTWAQARHLAEANKQVSEAVASYATSLIHDLQDTAAGLATAAHNYRNSESMSTGAVRGADHSR